MSLNCKYLPILFLYRKNRHFSKRNCNFSINLVLKNVITNKLYIEGVLGDTWGTYIEQTKQHYIAPEEYRDNLFSKPSAQKGIVGGGGYF